MKQLRWSVTGLTICWLCSGCANHLVVDGQIQDRALERVIANTSAARGIELQEEIVAKVIPRSELTDVLLESIRRDWTEQELRDYQDSLNVMGLWPADREIEAIYLDHVTSEITGVYVASHRAIYLVDESSERVVPRMGFILDERELTIESTLAHELVHALQHQTYPELVETRVHFRGQDDVASAIQAAIEGDALHFGELAVTPDESWKESVDERGFSMEQPPLADEQTPSIIRKSLDFPYTAGYRLARAEGAELLEDPPISTEQVLHDDKRREPFFAIDMQGLNEAFPSDCEAVHENTVGELSLSILLGDMEAEATPEAWLGWDGDRFTALRCESGFEFVWITQWDSESDALEFERAYHSIAGKISARANHLIPPTAKRNDDQVVVTSERLTATKQPWPTMARFTRVSSLKDLQERRTQTGTPSPP
jgi:hypothetical protein